MYREEQSETKCKKTKHMEEEGLRDFAMAFLFLHGAEEFENRKRKWKAMRDGNEERGGQTKGDVEMPENPVKR